MTDTEQKVLALWNEVRAERGYIYQHTSVHRKNDMVEALCRVIEQYEATKQELADVKQELADFKQKVSDTVEAYLNPNNRIYSLTLHNFIIPKPKPDPLVEIIGEINDGPYVETRAKYADRIRAALDALGFEIREKSK